MSICIEFTEVNEKQHKSDLKCFMANKLNFPDCKFFKIVFCCIVSFFVFYFTVLVTSGVIHNIIGGGSSFVRPTCSLQTFYQSLVCAIRGWQMLLGRYFEISYVTLHGLFSL